MKTTTVKQQFLELRAKGYSLRRIAADLKCSRQTLADWQRSMEAEITNLQNIELEGIFERARMLKAGRVRMLSRHLRKIEKELATRDLTKVPTDKLAGIFFLFLRELGNERCYLGVKSTDEMNLEKEKHEVALLTEKSNLSMDRMIHG